MSTWKDITCDKDGHVVAKDLYKAQSFYAGLFYLLVLVPAVVLLTPSSLVLPIEPGLALVTLAFSIQVIKEVSNYFNRKTADSYGQVLAEPGTDPVQPMPQTYNPNAHQVPPSDVTP